jgi:hypothetical protein
VAAASVGWYLMFTWGLIALAGLGAAMGAGRMRQRAFGTALFGAGYMILIFAPRPDDPWWEHQRVNDALRAACPWIDPVEPDLSDDGSEDIAAANRSTRQALERLLPMPFARPTPLREVLAYVAAAAPLPDGRRLPIHVDPVDLSAAETTLDAPVCLDMTGVPLQTTLSLVLRQQRLLFEIHDGLVALQCTGSCGYLFDEDPRLAAGHLFLALLAAGAGGLMAPLVAGYRGE